MRVVAGTARGRRLRAPTGEAIRPTADRVREAIFNMAGSRASLEGAHVVDLFAGTGAMGIEALSRGAAAATFVDRDPAAVSTIRANLAATGVEGGTVVRSDVLRFLHITPAFDVAFVDPPYEFDRWGELFGLLLARLAVAESDRVVDPGEGWEVLRTRRYGITVVTLAASAMGNPL
jgi:16S rRNA (guanine966-N2)-methyltransferase